MWSFFACVIAVVVCIAYVDRPMADYFNEHVRHTPLWGILDDILHPFQFSLVAALLFLFACGACLIAGRQLPEWTRIPFLCSYSLMWGLGAELIFKAVFGRLGPDPGYVRDHLYEFHFLHGDPRGSAMPSGHTLAVTALSTVLWLTAPRLRIFSALLVTVVVGILAVDNFHWLSDIIAGAYLGITIGWMTVKFQTNR